MVRICKHTFAPFFGNMRLLGKWLPTAYLVWGASLPKQRSANDLIPQSVKVMNWVVLCIMLKKSFATFSLLLYWGIDVYGKLNAGDFSIDWNALPVLFYGLLFSHASSYSLLIFLNPHASTLVRGIFVMSGPQQGLMGLSCFMLPLWFIHILYGLIQQQ